MTKSYSFVDPENRSQEIKLSLKFTRLFLDSIHSITPKTKLSEFVDFINFKWNVGINARLRSSNPSILVSYFLHAPLFKNINYTDHVDSYILENEIHSSFPFERSTEPNSNFEESEEIVYFNEEEEEKH